MLSSFYKKLIVSLFCIFLSISSFSQYYMSENDPGDIKWKQIETENFQIIFPEGSDSVAQKFSNMLQFCYVKCAAGMQVSPKKISVVLHAKSTIANGSVAWAPKRMEIYDVVPQSQFSNGWLEELAIHEYRHVVQMDKLYQGLTNILSYIFGEQAVAAVSIMYLPIWYLEGDAVVTETALSNAGRGRQPDFTMGLRAQLKEKKRYTYSKAFFGSFKNYVPNHYAMGYVVVANARNTFYPNMWNDVENLVARHPLRITPFNRALRFTTQMRKGKLYKEMFNKQQIEWNLQYDREIQKPFDTLTIRKPKEYTSYTHPYRISENQVIAERHGLGDISQLVMIKPGEKDKVLSNISFKQPDDRIHTNGNSVVWIENNSDIRWALRATSDICIYSFSTKKIQRIATGKRLVAPCITKIGDKIATVEVDEKSAYFITIYSTTTKQIIQKIHAPKGEYILAPSWNSTGEKLVCVTTSALGKRLIEINTSSLEVTELLPYTFDDLLNPTYNEDYILYSSSYSGVDNIYAYNLQTKNVSRVTVASFGTKFPSVYYNKLLFSDYTSDGYMIGQMDLLPFSWHTIDAVRKEKYELAQTLTIQENGIVDFTTMKETVFDVNPYFKDEHLFNIHSWMPLALDYDKGTVANPGYGVQVLSQDKLSTMSTSFGYRKNIQLNSNCFYTKATYTGFFPILDFELQTGPRKYNVINGNDTINFYHNVSGFSGGITIPLDFSVHSYNRLVQVSSTIFYESHKLLPDDLSIDERNRLRNSYNVGNVMYAVSAYNLLDRSKRDLQSKYGQIMQVGFVYTPFQNIDLYSDHTFATSRLFFPGLFKHHSIELYAGYEYNVDTTSNTFKGIIQMPRGYSNYVFTKKEFVSLHANYSLPVCYPDLAIGSLFYLQRISTNLFVDYAQNTHLFDDFSNSDTYKPMLTYGVEVNFDFNLFHMPVLLPFGYRFVYNPETKLLQSEVVLDLNISGF